jgi:peptidoglycan/xylan/chitin deacetylase (PgdA/CDA1 family)
LAEGHRIANHSLSHGTDFARLSASEKAREISAAHDLILRETGVTPIGFRAPGYHLDAHVIAALFRLGYRYDSSSLPGPAGLLMKAYMLLQGGGAGGKSFGRLNSVCARSEPHLMGGLGRTIWEYPIATFPFLRFPIHSTFIYRFGEPYLRAALVRLRRLRGHHIYLLHAVDGIDHPEPGLFAGRLIPLRWSYDRRRDFLNRLCALLAGRVTLTEDVVAAQAGGMLHRK